MKIFEKYIETVENPLIKDKLVSIIEWIDENYHDLEPVIKWNQPMYIHHDTYIIGFSVAKKHLNIAPEEPVISMFEERLNALGYKRTKMLIQISANQKVDFSLLKSILDFTIEDKKDITSFWR